MMPEYNPWRTIGTREVYRNAWFRVREDSVIRPDGSEGIYGVVELPKSVGIIALDGEGRIALVTQWRYVHEKMSSELPTGGVEGKDENILAAAKRELREETGTAAASWFAMGQIDNSNGATTDTAFLFLARELSSTQQGGDPTEAITVQWLKVDVAVRMVLEGEITESVSVAGILKAALYLRMGVVE